MRACVRGISEKNCSNIIIGRGTFLKNLNNVKNTKLVSPGKWTLENKFRKLYTKYY